MKRHKFVAFLILSIVVLGIHSLSFSDLNDFTNPGGSLNLADYKFIGENDNDWSGWTTANAGDVDGDGLSDILIGAHRNDEGDTDSGKTYLIFGSTILASGGTINLSSVDFTFIGELDGDYSSYSLATSGDIDGDSLSDILIGAKYNDEGADDAGKTYLILAETIINEINLGNNSINLSSADYSFIGEEESDWSGCSVSSPGDINGDGLSDILIGAYGNNQSAAESGKTYLILGSTAYSGGGSMDLSNADYSFYGEGESDYSGISVAGAGDINGDNIPDILIGAYGYFDGFNYCGKTYLILGSPALSGGGSMYLSNADYSFKGEGYHDHSGHCVAGAGDINGDSYDDILISSQYNGDGGPSAGKTYLILGSPSLTGGGSTNLINADYSFIGEANSDYSGYSIASAGDVNGDGLSDILIGAHWNDDDGWNSSGKTYLILGSASLSGYGTMVLSDASFSFKGEADYNHSGCSVNSCGDINGDGYSDILIGAYSNSDGGSGAGKSYIILGSELVTYVDCFLGDDSTGDGSSNNPYQTINKGITEAGNSGISRVIVRGGPYNEMITLQPGMELIGELRGGSLPPFIIGIGGAYPNYHYPYAVFGADNATIKNFVIYKAGIMLYGVSNMTIQENTVIDNYFCSVPLHLQNGASNNIIKNNIFYKRVFQFAPAICIGEGCNENEFINNTIHSRDYDAYWQNNAIGIYLEDNTLNNIFRNNIIQCNTNTFYGGTTYGFYADGANISTTIEYNRTPIQNNNVTLGAGNITFYPDFVSMMPYGFNYHLNPGSLCIDAGDLNPIYNDPDGTQNDMGAYGGPDSLDFQ